MNLKILFIASTTLLLFSNLALAALGIPHQFYGSVTINGNPAADGAIVTAKINGIEVGRTTTKSGKYGYEPNFYIDDPNNIRSGSTINFFVNDIDTGKSYPFQNGATTRLDLSIIQNTGTPTSAGSTGSTTGSSTSSNSNSGTNATNNQGTQTQGCIEKWTCTQWSSCEDSVQTRTCTDANKCGTEIYKPFESQPCGVKEKEEQQTQSQIFVLPTGFFLGLSATDWITGFVIAIVAALIIVFLFKRKKVAAPLNTIVPSTVISA